MAQFIKESVLLESYFLNVGQSQTLFHIFSFFSQSIDKHCINFKHKRLDVVLLTQDCSMMLGIIDDLLSSGIRNI